MKIYLNRNWN